MFARAFVSTGKTAFGRSVIACLAVAVVYPVVKSHYKLTLCEKTVIDVETHNAPVPAVHVETVVLDKSTDETKSDAVEATPVAAPTDTDVTVITEETEEEDAAWEEEKQKCSFCKMFLLSPCKLPFKRWSQCMDKAKAAGQDGAEVCTGHFGKLMDCTSEHTEYFQALRSMEESEDNVESGTTEDTATHTESRQVPVSGVKLEEGEDEK